MIPAELQARGQWVVWRFEERDGKQTKVPYQPNGRRAKADDPSTWTGFEEALEAIKDGFDDVGYVLAADDPYVGVDLDDCLDGDVLHPDAAAIVLYLDSYTERSPSGTGVKIFVRGNKDGISRCRTSKTGWGGEIEIYDSERFFCVTGNHLRGCPTTIEERQDKLRALLKALRPEPEPTDQSVAPQPVELEDEEILHRAITASNGADFERLWNGDINGYGSQSEADLALTSHLVFWTGGDPGRTDRLFRRSACMRPKWDAQRGDSTYGQRTIEKAISGATKFYKQEPSRGSRTVGTVGVLSGGGVRTVPPSPTPKGDGGDGTVPPWSSEEESQAPGTVEPFALALADFIAAKSETPPALIGDEMENLLPTAGLMILFGKGGKGKSTLAVDAVLHFASGIDWLGFKIEHPLRVLFIENEGPREPFRFKLELKRKLWEHELRGEIFIQTLDWGAFTLADEAHAGRLRAFVEQHEIDVIIGDPLSTLGIEGVGSPEETRKFMALMTRVGHRKDVAFLLLHHPRKEGAQEELDEISGAWGGHPDSLLRLDKLDGNRARLSFPKIRWLHREKRRTLILAFDPDTESFSVAHEEEDEERDYVAEIADLLSDGTWRIVRENAAPKKDGGIGAQFDTVKKELEKHPDRFISCNGKEVGRSAQATVWQLQEEDAEQA